MRHVFITFLYVLLVSSTGFAGEFQIEGKTFTLPDGFRIEKVAGLPVVQRPICADFDEQRRLYVAESSGTNDNVKTQLQQKPHRILRLQDTNGDGLFNHSQIFADKMMFPEGTLWYDGSLYVAAPPTIWKLTDTDDDGVADKREEWFQGKTLTGCANDLHGPYLGRDGWIYWCKGAFAEQTHEQRGKQPFVTRAAHIFRRRPEGGPIEPVMTGGMDNPVEVVFTPGGERIFTTTFLQHPGGGRRDGIIHAIYGGVYGKRHNVIDGHPRTGELMPVLSHLGPAAPAGLLYLESNALGDDFKGNLLTCCFNMRKIVRHRLAKQGATFSTSDSDFLVCDNVDFHPTDVLEDADGSLLVIDTGGWYKLCCPTSQLHKPDILGAIYRIRTTKNLPFDSLPTDLKSLPITELVKRLDASDGVIPRQAIHFLAKKGKSTIPALREVILNAKSPRQRLNSVWTLCRMDDLNARQATRLALKDSDATVRQAAVHAIGLWRDADAASELTSLLCSESIHNRRAAAEALGRIGSERAVASIFDACHSSNDRVLDHSIVFALVEIADVEGLKTGLESDNSDIRRVSMVALDQLPNGNLAATDVIADLASTHDKLRETANWIVSRHANWGKELIVFFREQLRNEQLTDRQQEILVARLANSSGDDDVQKFMVEMLRDSTGHQRQQMVLQAMQKSRLKQMPRSWQQVFQSILSNSGHVLVNEALQTVISIGIPNDQKAKWGHLLTRLAEDRQVESSARLKALSGLPENSVVDERLIQFLFDQLGSEDPATLSRALDALAKMKLTTNQLLSFVDKLDAIGPLEIGHALEILDQTKDRGVGERMLVALENSKSLRNVPVAILQDRLDHFGQDINNRFAGVFAKLDEDLPARQKHLDGLVRNTTKGDIRRGHQVFHSKKAACSTCHQMAYLGGTIGPDLSHIGKIRTRRDLLEAIVYPSLSFVRSYEPHQIITSSGRSINGILKEEDHQELVLVTTDRKEVRLSKDAIEERLPGRVSVMPSGLDQQLSQQELADLVAFLEAAK